MKLHATPISDLWVADTVVTGDERGAFCRFFCADDLCEAAGKRSIVQINHSRTQAVGAIRGLHFQYSPHAEMKMVRCLRGRVWDVAVDLRKNSPTFLKWHAEELSPDNGRLMIIPEGFAHGFQVLEAESELLYLHTASYVPAAEGGIRHDDPRFGIAWPLPVTEISLRDRQHSLLTADFSGISV